MAEEPSPTHHQEARFSRDETKSGPVEDSCGGEGEKGGGLSRFDGFMNCIATMSGADWDDRVHLQAKWSNVAKGWCVDVEWRSSK